MNFPYHYAPLLVRMTKEIHEHITTDTNAMFWHWLLKFAARRLAHSINKNVEPRAFTEHHGDLPPVAPPASE